METNIEYINTKNKYTNNVNNVNNNYMKNTDIYTETNNDIKKIINNMFQSKLYSILRNLSKVNDKKEHSTKLQLQLKNYQYEYTEKYNILEEYYKKFTTDFSMFLSEFDIYKDLKYFLKEKYSIQKCNNLWVKLWDILKNYEIIPNKVNETFIILDTSGILNTAIPCINHFIKSETNLNSYSWIAYEHSINVSNDTSKDECKFNDNKLQQSIYNNYKERWYLGESQIESLIDDQQSNIDLFIYLGHPENANDYINQEENYNIILKVQIEMAFKTLRKGGTLIMKFINLLKESTIDIIKSICNNFEEIYYYKPTVSKIYNTEFFIIAKNFDFITNNINTLLFTDDIINILNINFGSYLNNISFILELYKNKLNCTDDKRLKVLTSELKLISKKYCVEWLNANNIKPLRKKDKINLK